MGIFSFLHRKNESKNEVDISESEMKTHHTVKDEQRKGIADAQGLYPADLILLSLAHCYRVTEKEYPRPGRSGCHVLSSGILVRF